MATRKEVADYANVSETTVSRVVNNNGYVSLDNREKVENAIKVLGYSPNFIARSLKTKETKQILFYATDLINPFYIEVYQGIEDYAVKHGYIIVVSGHFEKNMIRQRQFDGVIVSNILPDQQKEFLDLNIPIVATNYSGQHMKIPSVDIDVKGGAREVMNYLYQCGHRRIGFICARISFNERYTGYLSALEEMGLPVAKSRIITSAKGKSNFEYGYNAALNLIENGLDVTAIFSFNDAMAIGAMAAFSQKGIRIPEDISIIGFDDIIQSRYASPPLTTIQLPKFEQGMESVKLLIQEIKGEEVSNVSLNTKLIIRDTVSKIIS